MPKPPTSDHAGSDPSAPAAASFEEFCTRHRSDVVRRLVRKGSSPEDADDLAQDVLLAVWLAQRNRTIHDLPRLIQCAIDNARVDLWRKGQTRRDYEPQLAYDYELLQPGLPSIESAALQAERARLLLALRQEQPQAYRAYFLRRECGLEYLEIARVMNIGRNTASKLVRIALTQLLSAGVEGDYL